MEKYLKDRLTEAESQEFDALLHSDPEFREEVEFQQDVKLAVIAEEDATFNEMLSDFESEARATGLKTADSEQGKVISFPKKWLVAASIALLAGLAYFFTVDRSADTEALFAQNFKPYANVTYPLTRGEEPDDAKAKAFSAYALGDYAAANSLFENLSISEKEPYYLFYRANALIQLNRAAEAVPLLQEHLKTQDSLTDKSHWYLAMAYLQMQDTDKARQALRTVVEQKAYNAEKAKLLLDEL